MSELHCYIILMTTNHSLIYFCSFSGEPQLSQPFLLRLMFQPLEVMEKQERQDLFDRDKSS